jgi:CheY-like chemotaxis protein
MRKPRAIICDDDIQILDIFKRTLDRMGYEVLTSETAITCAFYREHANSCPQHDRCADVLITDYEMPDMTGIDLLEMQHRGGCKLISKSKALMSTNDDPRLKKRVEALGCHFFLKPLFTTTLRAWLKECQTRFDLSEPLASELFQPAKKMTVILRNQTDIIQLEVK